ncbi:MAG: sigma-54 dependent transcriptional regulator [Candidatus Cloacimonetes bacterium]|nr:sigma-54 dependent transcriptional regulator [Candidatus Cloacimonadota bacterium]
MESILVIEDNKDMQFLLSNILNEEGFKVCCVGEGKNAFPVINKGATDLILLDMRLPGMNGMAILKKIGKIDKEIPVIMLTAYGEIKDAVKAMQLGAYDYITKPFVNEELILIIRKALKTRSLNKEVKSLRMKLNKKRIYEKELGESRAIKRILKQAELVAPTNMCVMIQGKSGTGKEVIANIIHHKSNRKSKPFIAVDCGAIPATLLESELFGYEKGAFTGANSTKKGKFEKANGGTILLDEITNLPFEGQASILRAIEERKINYVGGKKPVDLDVRIIATTNLDFLQEVKKGNFREDLYHRLNQFQINLPTLKERKEDIPVLAKEFLKEANLELGKNIKDFSVGAIRRLLNYDWPGNIRELKHMVKKAVLLTESGNITGRIIFLDSANQGDSIFNIEEINDKTSFDQIIGTIESDLILKAIKKAKGNKTKAAKLLNMNRKTLYRKMNILGIPL